jgi:hypothetical protein
MKRRVNPAIELAQFVEMTSFLSADQVHNAIPAIEVLRTLNRRNISFILVGTHGLSAWRREGRGTEDVDILVKTTQYKQAIQALQVVFDCNGSA